MHVKSDKKKVSATQWIILRIKPALVLILKNLSIVQVNGDLRSGLIFSESFGSLWAPEMSPPLFPTPHVHRALPPLPSFKTRNEQASLKKHPPSLVPVPVPIPAEPPSLPIPTPPFSFPQKNPDYFPTYSCKEEIYVCSSSVIELDCSYSTNNDGSDSGIYNASTTTGSHAISDSTIQHWEIFSAAWNTQSVLFLLSNLWSIFQCLVLELFTSI